MTAFITLLTLSVLLLSAGCGAVVLLRKEQLALPLAVAAWCTALALFVANWCLAGAVPFGNMRHVLCFFPLVLGPAAFYMQRCRRINLTVSFALVAALSMLGALCMPMQAAWRQMPALQSPWFAPHVIAYVLSYGLMTVAALMVLIRPLRGDKAAQDERTADALVKLAFPFMTFGLWSGAL
ncbi:MAG: hypothetical protein II295_06195, partial [Akkermansia sp.]|nr:hypothetical protein [Akkermansia sp.]